MDRHNGAFQSLCPGNPRNPENKQPVVPFHNVQLGYGMPFFDFWVKFVLFFPHSTPDCYCCSGCCW